MASQNGRNNSTTRKAIWNVENSKVTAERLHELCYEYMDKRDKKSFRRFQKNLFSSHAMPVAATFPAFLDPFNFPMADRQVTEWVSKIRLPTQLCPESPFRGRGHRHQSPRWDISLCQQNQTMGLRPILDRLVPLHQGHIEQRSRSEA